MRIPVVCKSYRHWGAFVSDSAKNVVAFRGKWEVKIGDDIYFYVPINDPYKLRGMCLERAIIYNCIPNSYFMEVLACQFRNVPINIEKVWN